MNEIWGKEPLALKTGGGYFGYKNIVALSNCIYGRLGKEIQPLKTGVEPVKQLAGRISNKMSAGLDFKLAGFICPFYEINEARLKYGFGTAVSGIGRGSLEDFPRYQKKFDKFLKLVSVIDQIFGRIMNLNLNILMGDTGVINARTMDIGDTERSVDENIGAYKVYMRSHYPNLGNLNVNFSRFSDTTKIYFGLAGSFSDLEEDGRKLHREEVIFATNQDVLRKVENERLQSKGNGDSIYESFGFMLNYGLAGMVLRNMETDILIGTDAPGSYMNYLYHAFIKPKDLLVIVPK